MAIEVRRLAQNAAQASNDVKELIDRSADEVRGGAQLVADAAKKLDRIVEAVEQNAGHMQKIAEGGASQSAAI